MLALFRPELFTSGSSTVNASYGQITLEPQTLLLLVAIEPGELVLHGMSDRNEEYSRYETTTAPAAGWVP